MRTSSSKLLPIFIVLFLVVGGGLAAIWYSQSDKNSNNNLLIKQKQAIAQLVAAGRYRCCLNEPCSYCFSDEDHQEREKVCDCLDRIAVGKHPCGECIGEILEGEGNPLVAEYFAVAIAEEIGQEYLDVLRKIVADKYNLPEEKQL